MKNTKKVLALLVAAMMIVSALAACGNNNQQPTVDPTPSTDPTPTPVDPTPAPVEPTEPEYVPTAAQAVAGKEYGVDYTALYEKYGKTCSIADVTEDPETGLAYATFDGTEYELGLDFLTMAMVYNTSTEGTSYETED